MRLHPIRSATCSALLGLVVTTAVATPAHAESERFRDPRGDAVGTGAAFGAMQAADILRTTGTHESGRFRAALEVVDLSPDEDAGVFVRVRVPSGTDYGVQAFRSRGTKESGLVRYAGDGQETDVRCDGLAVSFSNARDRITVTVPRTCLRKPRFIRFGAATVAVNPRTERTYRDDARRDGLDPQRAQVRLGTKQLRRN